MLRPSHKLPGTQVFSAHTASATDQQDLHAALQQVTANLFPAAALLGRPLQPLHFATNSSNVFDAAAQQALRRLHARAGAAALPLLLAGSAADWESAITASFDTGASMQLAESTAQDQLIQEFRVALLLGRKLTFTNELLAPIKRTVDYRGPAGETCQMEVDLLFPATSRTITRLMQAWRQRKVGSKCSTGTSLATAAAAAPKHRMMPLTFACAVSKLLFWQKQLMSALVELNSQMGGLKDKGVADWYHPASLTSGSQFATTSAAFRARQAASGMISTVLHLYQGSRQAETFRACWDHTSVPGVDSDLPVWALGLAGVLPLFQARRGTGFSGVYYHAKGYMDFQPDFHDILPASCSGLCLASITTLAFVVLTYLQPASPADPIQRRPARSSRSRRHSSDSDSDDDCDSDVTIMATLMC